MLLAHEGILARHMDCALEAAATFFPRKMSEIVSRAHLPLVVRNEGPGASRTKAATRLAVRDNTGLYEHSCQKAERHFQCGQHLARDFIVT